MWYMNAGVDANPTPKFLGLNIRCIREIGTSVEDPPNEIFKVYPNPSKEKISVEYPNGELLSISVFNLSGQIMLQIERAGHIAEIDISALPNGLYFLQVATNNHTMLHKFIKN